MYIFCLFGKNEFYDRMTVHRNRFLVNKTNRCTKFQFYWYYYSTCFWHPFCSSSGVLSRTFDTFYAVVMNRLLPVVGWNSSYSWYQTVTTA